MFEEIRKTAIKSAKEAGQIQMKHFGRVKEIEYKGEINLVTEVDKLCEKKIIEIIKDEYPNHNILAEEGNNCDENDSPYKWVIDPLDGTTNYAHGYPCFCVSIALEKAGEIVIGVVYNPVLDELFWAEKSKGAFLNGEKIQVSKTKELDKSLLVTGFPYDIRDNPDYNLNHFRNFIVHSQAVRRDGAAALDQCYVAMGRFDGFWESKLFPWDVAAGSLIIAEAGGKVTNFGGDNFSIYSKEILATNGKIHKQMIKVLKG